ncbi:hypothetical protein EVAR_102892_1 [Eumeta japonica]|uniref:Mariner Mos1 transposase n=1 Tax=Eumeta variegata TaxID=151549 RepID=A0A4C1UNJ7_EUMVA|nr:hypothetical protein EVAR_102892_1 [Eumeta japonica]
MKEGVEWWTQELADKNESGAMEGEMSHRNSQPLSKMQQRKLLLHVCIQCAVLPLELGCFRLYKKAVLAWIPHNLTEAQKTDRVTWCNAMLTRFKEEVSTSVWDIITGYELWVYCYDLKTKQQVTRERSG